MEGQPDIRNDDRLPRVHVQNSDGATSRARTAFLFFPETRDTGRNLEPIERKHFRENSRSPLLATAFCPHEDEEGALPELTR